MGENRHSFPYRHLGSQLKRRRESIHESLAEVSGAVEIDEEMLSKIEQGMLLPSEDVLLLLISHLSISEDEALRLWAMAGYERQKLSGGGQDDASEDQTAKQTFMVIPVDNRVLYTDQIQVTANKHGLVLNFLQSGNSQPTTIARVGMSRDYAESMLQIIEDSLRIQHQPRMLPKPKTTTDDHTSN